MNHAALPLSALDGLVAGVDEAGRGPLAGPVVAAAVILAPNRVPAGLDDSKKLSATERERLAAIIRRDCVASAVAWADVAEIDAINILQATMLAMRRSIAGLAIWPETVLVDGNRLPSLGFHGRRLRGDAIVGGDGAVPAISAASILAKVTRDAMMARAAELYPGYGFDRHKGYGTKAHLDQLRALGACPIHRWSFRPVRETEAQDSQFREGTSG